MKLKKLQEKGITLIALVITIIILLILAGVTIGIVIKTEILEKSKTAADMYKISEYKENIEIVRMYAQMEKISERLKDSLKDIMVEKLKEEEWVSSVQTNEEDTTLEENQIKIITKDNYMMILEILKDGTINYISEGKSDDEPYPVITTLQQLSIEGTEDGEIKAKVQLKAEVEKTTKIEKVEIIKDEKIIKTEKYNTLTIDETYELTEEGIYTFKVITNQNKSTSKKIIISLPSKIEITAKPSTPRNTEKEEEQNGVATGPITVTIKYGETDLKKQYKKEEDLDWTTTEKTEVQIKVTKNTKIIAKYSDGTSSFNSKTYNIQNVDNVAPTITNQKATVEGTKIIVTADFDDKASDGAAEKGIAGVEKKLYSLDGEKYQTSNELTATKVGEITVYIKAIDYAGNETEVTTEVNVEGYTVTIQKDEGIESVTPGTEATIPKGETLSISATTLKGYEFEKWEITEGKGTFEDETSEETTITPESNITIKATSIEKIEFVLDNTKGTENVTLTGKAPSYNNPVIPVGFGAINTEDAKWISTDEEKVDDWNKGLVISDNIGNEFVWIPVHDEDVEENEETIKAVEYKKWCTSGYSYSGTTDGLPTKVKTTWGESEESQITEYEGFYIARFEASKGIDSTPLSKKKQIPWSNISTGQSKTFAESMYNESDYIQSGLLTGKMWDTVMRWIANEIGEEAVISDSTSWGNYINAEITGITGYFSYRQGQHYESDWIEADTKESGEYHILKTGESDYTKRKNIYDLAGNYAEWTSEMYTYKIVRGGYVTSNGSSAPAAYRTRINVANRDYEMSFRVALYIK